MTIIKSSTDEEKEELLLDRRDRSRKFIEERERL